jgi:hypothetical protein
MYSLIDRRTRQDGCTATAVFNTPSNPDFWW